MRAGLTCVPLDPKLTADEIENLLKDSGTKAVFCSRTVFLEKIQSRIQDDLIKIIAPDVTDSALPGTVRFSDIPDASPGPADLPEVDPEDVASLGYTCIRGGVRAASISLGDPG